jgi:flagellar motor switch protein FliG
MDIEPFRDAVRPLNGPSALAGAKRAAALLLALDETAAGTLTAGLDAAELMAVARAMSELETLPAPELEALLDRFAAETSAAHRAA